MKKTVLLVLTVLLFSLISMVSAEEIAIKINENVGLYSRPTPYATFLGWAKMAGHYPVLDTVTGNKGHTWLRIRIEDGTEGYIPQSMTTPVIDNIAEQTKSYVLVHHEGNIHMHRNPRYYHYCNSDKPGCDSPIVGWARKGTVYPVIEGPVGGWVRIAFEDGTTGWVAGNLARPYDPVKDSVPRKIRVTHSTSVLVRKEPDKDSPCLTGIRPGEEFPCVYICENGWCEIELPTGAYGYVSGKLVEVIEL